MRSSHLISPHLDRRIQIFGHPSASSAAQRDGNYGLRSVSKYFPFYVFKTINSYSKHVSTRQTFASVKATRNATILEVSWMDFRLSCSQVLGTGKTELSLISPDNRQRTSELENPSVTESYITQFWPAAHLTPLSSLMIMMMMMITTTTTTTTTDTCSV